MSLRGLQTCVCIDELDGMVPWAMDIGNGYLEAVTSEKVYIRAGPEFEELEGYLLIIYKALYGGLHLSGKLFGQLLQECLQELGFEPSFAESMIYMRKYPIADHYEYAVTYVDDLCTIMKDLLTFLSNGEKIYGQQST